MFYDRKFWLTPIAIVSGLTRSDTGVRKYIHHSLLVFGFRVAWWNTLV